MSSFPNRRRKPIDHLSRAVQQLANKFGMQLPTATEGRHAAATATAMKCYYQERDAVATTMSHSYQTQMAYYVNSKSKKEAERGFVFCSLRQGELVGNAAKPRVPLTEEVELIEMYFKTHIASFDVPSADECKQFLKDHSMDRDHKQIRDKIRHILKVKRAAED